MSGCGGICVALPMPSQLYPHHIAVITARCGKSSLNAGSCYSLDALCAMQGPGRAFGRTHGA